jgi:hypothetical protein
MSQDEVLAGFGADPGEAVGRTLAEAEAGESSPDEGYGPFVRVGRSGEWLFAWEETSAEGIRPEVLQRVSSSGQAAAVRHALDAFAQFAYAVGGALVSQVVTIPPYTRQGSDPDRFLSLLRRVGLDAETVAEQGADDEELPLSWLEAVLMVAEQALGLSLTRQEVGGRWPSARILPLLDEVSVPGQGSDWQFSINDPVVDLLVRYAPAQAVATLVAVQAQMLLEDTGLAEHAGLQDAVRAAARGQQREVANEEPLGLILRGLMREWYVAQRDAEIGPAPGQVPPQERYASAARADAVRAVRAVLADGGAWALAEVLVHRRQWAGPQWREQVLAGLRAVDVPREKLHAAEQQWLRQGHDPGRGV